MYFFKLTKMENDQIKESVLELVIGNVSFTFVVKNVKGIPILNLDEKKGGYIFLTRHKESWWTKFARWVDKKILRNKPTYLPSQWIDISWFNGNDHIVRSYNFIPIGKTGGKTTLAPYAASLGMLYCFLKKENPTNTIPDFVQVHFDSVFENKSFVFGKIKEHESNIEILSSFSVCQAMRERRTGVSDDAIMH